MGLDMYLTKRTYVGNKYRKPAQLVKVTIPKNQKDVSFPTGKIENERITEIIEEVGYWRKANAIHKWFVDNVQDGKDDCGDYWVDPDELKKLLEIVKKVLNASKLIKGKIQNGSSFEKGKMIPIMENGHYIENPSIAKKLLPAEKGFFFGSYDYDEYYIQDLKETEKIISKALEEKSNDIHYSSSW